MKKKGYIKNINYLVEKNGDEDFLEYIMLINTLLFKLDKKKLQKIYSYVNSIVVGRRT